MGLVGKEGEGAHQQKVSDSQVQEADISHAAKSYSTGNDPDDQRITKKAKKKENAVKNWKENGSVTFIHT